MLDCDIPNGAKLFLKYISNIKGAFYVAYFEELIGEWLLNNYFFNNFYIIYSIATKFSGII